MQRLVNSWGNPKLVARASSPPAGIICDRRMAGCKLARHLCRGGWAQPACRQSQDAPGAPQPAPRGMWQSRVTGHERRLRCTCRADGGAVLPWRGTAVRERRIDRWSHRDCQAAHGGRPSCQVDPPAEQLPIACIEQYWPASVPKSSQCQILIASHLQIAPNSLNA